jgi:transcription antitermination protein NusB
LTTRRRSREFALQVLYQWDMTQQDVRKDLAHFKEHFLLIEKNDPFLDQIVQGVLTHCQEIDRLIERYSEHWRLSRMAPIDRTILRIAVFELLHCEEIPPKVTLNEAVDLGKQFGSDESGSFINGILDRILNEVVQKSIKSTSLSP